MIQTQTTENYFITNNQLKEYLDTGNISLSAASISFEHPNFYFDPMFNLIFFYNSYGFNFLNYYKFDKKENLLGVYHKPVKEIGNGKMHRNYLFEKIKQILNEDFTPYESLDYNLKSIVQPYEGFGHWGNNHITSYIDLTTSVCNVIFETMSANGNLEKDEHEYSYYGRQYITEKTLKAICFSEENIFFIWYGPTKLYKHLMEIRLKNIIPIDFNKTTTSKDFLTILKEYNYDCVLPNLNVRNESMIWQATWSRRLVQRF